MRHWNSVCLHTREGAILGPLLFQDEEGTVPYPPILRHGRRSAQGADGRLALLCRAPRDAP